MELEGNLWILFVIDTILIAAAGYVINDIFDQKADSTNKPNKIFIGEGMISPLSGWVYYFLLVLIGFGIAFYIAYRIDKLLLLSIYPIAVGLLFLYSSYFKRLPLLGNLVVSIFCAFVPAIIWYAEFDMVESLKSVDLMQYNLIVNVFVAYITFAFLSTLVREIVKDVEDIEGDWNSNYRTLPIYAGQERANVVALFFSVFLLLSYGLWFVGYDGKSLYIIGGIVLIGLILPTMVIIRLIYRAKSQSDYSLISKRLKYLMIGSLFIFLCILFIIARINNSKKEESKMIMIDPSELKPGPIQHEDISESQLGKIKSIHKTFEEVYPISIEETITNFKRDLNVDNEINLWMKMKETFISIVNDSKYTNVEQRKEVFKLILMRSMMSNDDVRKNARLKVIDNESAVTILNQFESKLSE